MLSELGAVHEAMGKFDLAESSYQAATKLRTDDWTSLNSLGSFYYRRGRYQDAIPLFVKVTEMAPDDSLGYTNLGATHAMAGQYDAAAENFKKSLALRQTASAYTNLGTIYYFLGRCTEAVPLMERASELAPKSEQMWGNLGDAYACAGSKRDAALSAYRRAVQLGLQRLDVNPNDGETISVVALYEAKLGDTARALANIRKARRIAPASRKVMWESALVYELAGDRNEALTALTGAIHGGQPLDEVRGEPALAKLRADPRYQKLMASIPAK